MKGNIGHLVVTAGLTFLALWLYDTISTQDTSGTFPNLS